MLNHEATDASLDPSTRDVERALRSRSSPAAFANRRLETSRDEIEEMVHALERVQEALEVCHDALHGSTRWGEVELDVSPLRDAAADVARLARAAGLSSGQTLVLLDRSFRAIDACRGDTDCCRSYSVVMTSASRAYFTPE